jgi:lysophospholipase L1-like esterase
MPASSKPSLVTSHNAVGAIAQFAAVAPDGSQAAAGGIAVGFAQTSAPTGKRVAVAVDGSSLATAGGTIGLYDGVEVGAGGTVVKLASGYRVGTALTAGVAGDVVEVLVQPAVDGLNGAQIAGAAALVSGDWSAVAAPPIASRALQAEYLAAVYSPAPTITEPAVQSIGSILRQADYALFRWSNGLTAPVTGLTGQVGVAYTGRNRNDSTGVGITEGTQWAVEFDYYGAVLEAYLYAGAACLYWIWVDGAPLSAAPAAFAAPGNTFKFKRIDFTTAAERRIRIEGRGVNAALNGVRDNSTVFITSPRDTRPPVVAFLLDSYGDGRKATDEMTGFVRRLGRNLGVEAWQFPSKGGQGLIYTTTTPVSKHIDRLPYDLFTLPTPAAVVTGGSINDLNGTWNGTVGPAAVALVAAIRAQWPAMPIAFLSPLFVGSATTYNVMSDQIKAALAAAYPGVEYLDYATRPLMPGTGRVGTTAGDGIADLAKDADNIHPTQLGHDIIADAVAADLRRIWSMG